MIKLVKGNESLTGIYGHEYVSVKMVMEKSKLDTVIEITDKSFDAYKNSRKHQETFIRLLSKTGRKILLFHNAQYGINEDVLKYDNTVYSADLLVCCHSLFLEKPLRDKAILKTPLRVRTEVFEYSDRKFLKIISATEGFILKDKFNDNESEISIDTLLERI